MLPRPDIGTTDELVICLTDEDLLSTTDSPAEKYAEYLERIATLSTQGTKRVVVKLNTESPSMYTQPDNAVAQEGLRVLAALFATLPSCNQVETFDGTGVEFTPDQTTSLAGVPHIKLSDGSIPALPVGFDGCIKTLDLREVNGDGAHALVEAATKTTTLEVLKMVGEHLARLCLSTVVLPATQGNVLRAVRIEFSAVARKEFMPFLASLDRLEHLEFGMSAHIPDEMDAVEFVLPVGYLPRLIRFGGPARSVMSVCAGRRIRHLLIDHLGEDDTPDTYLRALEGVSGLDTLEVASVADLDEPFISEVLERLPGLRSLSITASKSGCKPEMQTLKAMFTSIALISFGSLEYLKLDMTLAARCTSWELEKEPRDEARLRLDLETFHPSVKSVVIMQEKYFDGDDDPCFDYKWVYGHEGKANQVLGEEDPLRWD